MSLQREASFSLEEPFHGTVWLRIAQLSSDASVRLVVSLKSGWDADIQISASRARVFAETSGPQIAQGETPDGHTAVVIMEDDRLAIVILQERLSDVLILGEHAKETRDVLGGGL